MRLTNKFMISLTLMVLYIIGIYSKNIIPIIIGIIFIGIIALVIYIILSIIQEIYNATYFKSVAFFKIKSEVEENVKKCNEIYERRNKLKSLHVVGVKKNYGHSKYQDKSRYNYKRPNLKNIREAPNEHQCTLEVFKNAKTEPFKYLCKYFNIDKNEQTLRKLKKMLNDFLIVEQANELLITKISDVRRSVEHRIPFLAKRFAKNKLMKELGFEITTFDNSYIPRFDNSYFPKYRFIYISPGGNSSMETEITLNKKTLEEFIMYISELVESSRGALGQRALVTPSLREKIKQRDEYTCKMCGLSTKEEPNLLLEIDHIIPLSKNGITTEENLQTLCWRCNRAKGNKIL